MPPKTITRRRKPRTATRTDYSTSRAINTGRILFNSVCDGALSLSRQLEDPHPFKSQDGEILADVKSRRMSDDKDVKQRHM